MKLRYLLIAVAALVLQASASEGKRWWSHIEFLADDALEGRNVGSAAFEKAATYVEGQFKEIGLKPGGVSGYRQPVKFESRVLVPEQSKLALLRSGVEEPLTPREDASLSARGELDGSVEAPMVFVGYGLSIPEAKWDELAGLDLHGKIAVYVNTTAPVDVSDNVKSHVSSAGERWAVLKKAGAIGVATFPNPRPPVGTTSDAAARRRSAAAVVRTPSPTDSRSRGSRASGAGGAGRVHHGDAQRRRKAPCGQRPHDRRAGATDCRQEAASTLSVGGHASRPGGREAPSRSTPRTSSASTKGRIRS